MGLFRSAIQEYRHNGLKKAVNKSISFITRRIREEIWLFKLKISNNNIKYNNIRLNLDNPYISKDTKLRFMQGIHESQETQLINTYLPHDCNVIELGAGIGFISCYINELLDEQYSHIAVEAHPGLIPDLRRNAQLNNANFSICNKAYVSENTAVEFQIADDFRSGTVQSDERETIDVEGVSLAALLDMYNISKFTLVADIEGGEFDLLKNEADILGEYCEAAIIEFHNLPRYDIPDAINKLKNQGFIKEAKIDDVFVFMKAD